MIFQKDFYKTLCDEIHDYAEFEDEVKEEYTMELYVEDMIVELTASFEIEWCDDSFDHAFGTEYFDPYPTLGKLSNISDVLVWNKDTDEQIDGFNIDDFWATFDIYEYHGFKKGDKISFSQTTRKVDGTFLAYNTESLEYKIKTLDGKTRNVKRVYMAKE